MDEKYVRDLKALDEIYNVQDLHASAPLSIQKFSQISSIFFACSQFYFQNFTDFSKTLSKIHELIFDGDTAETQHFLCF